MARRVDTDCLPKGRPSKVKYTKKQARQLTNKSELERLD